MKSLRTLLQLSIELLVTNGLGYNDSRRPLSNSKVSNDYIWLAGGYNFQEEVQRDPRFDAYRKSDRTALSSRDIPFLRLGKKVPFRPL